MNYIEKTKMAVDLKNSGVSLDEIALRMGVVVGTVRKYIDQEEWRRRHALDIPDHSWMTGISTRACIILDNVGIRSKEEARQAIQSGVLGRKKQRNFGPKTFEELCRWVGVPVPAKPVKLCPHCGKPI